MPGLRLLRLIPQGELVSEAAKHGLAGVGAQYGVNLDQLQSIYDEGSVPNQGSADEFRMLVAQVVSQNLEYRRDELTLAEWLDRMSELDAYLKSSTDTLVAIEEASLGDVGPNVPQMVKWDSGFRPFDMLLDGFYQGILTVMAKPGHGKTSFMLSLMEALRASGVVDEIWFYETEIPKALMLYRMGPMLQRTKFLPADVLKCGMVTSQSILREVMDNPNPRRAIFIDSPDVITGGVGEGRRFGIEAVYRDCIAIKERSSLVVAASQVRRADGRMGMESVSEAWAKSFYSDMMIGLTKTGKSRGAFTEIRAVCPKNRFGVADRELLFSYNYADLVYSDFAGVKSAKVEEEDEWD